MMLKKMDSYFYLQILLSIWIMILSMVNSYEMLLDVYTARATSSSILDHGYAAKTIDGNHDQSLTNCMHTAQGQSEAWLMIDIGNIVNLRSLRIWYRNDGIWGTKRLRDFSIFASKNSIFRENDTCYQDSGDRELPTVLKVNCFRTARYIKIYKDKQYDGDHGVFLEICEVEIYGCPRRKFAANCTTCDYCENDCDINGQCDAEGCADEKFHPPFCRECKRGYFGRNCSFSCGHCKNYATCDHVTGSCPSGLCEQGWKHTNEKRCDQECDDGSYGINCRYNCTSHCARGLPCNKVDGICLRGCADGWINTKCDKECNEGYYGRNCSRTCGHCNKNVTCDHVTGSCPAGFCEPGWKHTIERRCDHECDDGSFGLYCLSNCSRHCALGLACNKVDGSCVGGCADGWIKQRCNESCSPGWYGRECQEQCGYCDGSMTCNHVTGFCPALCQPGYHGKKCSEICNDGWYGRECKEPCGYCRGNRPCHHMTGSCLALCEPGYHGDKCKESEFSQLLAILRQMLNPLRELYSFKRRRVGLIANITSPTDLK